jgi:hypothetical protein
VLEPDPVARGDHVKRVPVRVRADLGLVVAGPDNPLPGRHARGHRGDARVQLVESIDPQVDLGEREPEPDHVVVRVMESGNQRQPAQIDDVLRAHVRLTVVDADNAPGRHRDRPRPRPTRVHREHVGVDEQKVGFVGHGS